MKRIVIVIALCGAVVALVWGGYDQFFQSTPLHPQVERVRVLLAKAREVQPQVEQLRVPDEQLEAWSKILEQGLALDTRVDVIGNASLDAWDRI